MICPICGATAYLHTHGIIQCLKCGTIIGSESNGKEHSLSLECCVIPVVTHQMLSGGMDEHHGMSNTDLVELAFQKGTVENGGTK